MQEDKKIDVHAVQRVHFVPRPDGGLGFALVIETQDKGTLGFALPLPALVQIFEMLPKMFADLLRTQPLTGSAIPENLTHMYWDSLSSVIAKPILINQSHVQEKSALPVKKTPTAKPVDKKAVAKPAVTKAVAKPAPAKKAAAKPAAKTKSAKK
jgi:hypothetical protein